LKINYTRLHCVSDRNSYEFLKRKKTQKIKNVEKALFLTKKLRCKPSEQQFQPTLHRSWQIPFVIDPIGVARIYCWGTEVLSILQEPRILCRNVLPKQCNLTFIRLQIEFLIPCSVKPLLYLSVPSNTSVKPSKPLLSYVVQICDALI